MREPINPPGTATVQSPETGAAQPSTNGYADAAVTGRKAIKKTPFLPYIHNFRAIAILFIVAIHCLRFFEASGKPPFFQVVLPLLSRGTFLFVFIAGYLFQHLSGKFEAKTYWLKKFQYVIVPYLIVSLPIIAYRIVTNNPPDTAMEHFPDFAQLPVVFQAVYYYATGSHLIPFWFIPMVFFYYLLAPILVKLDRDGRIYYALPLFMLISLLVTRADLQDIHLAFVHYFSIYLLGMFFSRYRDQIIPWTDKRSKWLVAATGLVIAASILYYSSAYREQIVYFQKLLLSWSFIYSLWKYDKYIPRWLGRLADMSFGIFFLHYYFIFAMQTLLKKLTGSEILSATAINFLVILLLTTGLCFVTLYVIKKIFGIRSRWLVGY